MASLNGLSVSLIVTGDMVTFELLTDDDWPAALGAGGATLSPPAHAYVLPAAARASAASSQFDIRNGSTSKSKQPEILMIAITVPDCGLSAKAASGNKVIYELVSVVAQ